MEIASKTQPGHCEQHGDYIARFFAGRWLGCPECAKAAIVDSDRQEREREAVERKTKRRALARLPERLGGATFDNYQRNTAEQLKAHAMFLSFAENFDAVLKVGAKLTVLGTTGTGKTHLACAALNRLLDQGRRVRYCEADMVAKEIRRSYEDSSQGTELDILEFYAAFDLLVLDEIGSGKGTEAELQVIVDILGMRHNAKKPTIVISNLATEKFKACVGDRIYSRLNENGRFLTMDWGDHRLGENA